MTLRKCRWCGGEGSLETDRNGKYIVSCTRCHRETQAYSQKVGALSAWHDMALHLPPHRKQSEVIAKIVSKEPYQIEVIEERGRSMIRMYAWCFVDMDEREARRLINDLEDAIKKISMETSDDGQTTA